MSEDKRWIVKRANGELDDVGAERATITQSGALVIESADDELVIAYSAGTWTTVELEPTS